MVAAFSSPVLDKPKLGVLLQDAFPTLWGVPWLTEHKRLVLFRLSRCGTGELGMMQFVCDTCHNLEWRPLGCQDRHCPSCGVRKTETWAQARVSELMDAPYFHLVFTIPGDLYDLAEDNQEEVYSLYFDKVRETVTAFANNLRHLGGTPAFFCVLHTTNRRLGYHPHIHVVIAGAAYNEAKDTLAVVDNEDFLFPVRALAASFRGRFLSGLRELAKDGKLSCTRPSTIAFTDDRQREKLFSKLFATNWQVRIDAATGGAERVIRYLARYTYRTAISNARLARYSDGDVTYTWRDRKTRRRRAHTLPLLDFVRRFAKHILPKGFQRIRFYGLLSPAKRGSILPKAQAAAQKRARLRGLSIAVKCSLRPEHLPAICCQVCGAEDIRATAVLRGSSLTLIHPKAYPIPPPAGPKPERREAM